MYSVARVIDGETIVLHDRTIVRLAGIIAPRAADAGEDVVQWAPAAAAHAELQRLVSGRNVAVARVSSGPDRYGRVIGHVFVVDGRERIWAAAHLLRQGHARAEAGQRLSQCTEQLLGFESEARLRRLGLWEHAAYRPRSASRTWTLAQAAGTYQLVIGTVARVATVRGRTYLNFGEDYRTDFTVSIAAADARRLIGVIGPLAGLTGKRVIARGWIERCGGPMIELIEPGQLEVLAEQAPGGPDDGRPAANGDRPDAGRPGGLEL